MPLHHTHGPFSRAGQVDVAEGGLNALDMTGVVGRCEVRSQSGALLQEFVFRWFDAAQRLFEISASEQVVQALPVGTHLIVVELQMPDGQWTPCYRDLFIYTRNVVRA